MSRIPSAPFVGGLTREQAISNISAVLDLATAEEVRAGVAWYPTARRSAALAGRLAGFKGRRATAVGAGIIAATSPSCEWTTNVAVAFALVANGGHRSADDATRYQSRANIDKAARILTGADALDVLNGPKVRAFFACIVNPNDDRAVCIDRHAVAVAYGRALSDRETSNAVAVLKSVNRYDAVADAYRAVAAARGLTPSQVQAITWVAWRRLKDGARTYSLASAVAA